MANQWAEWAESEWTECSEDGNWLENGESAWEYLLAFQVITSQIIQQFKLKSQYSYIP